MTSIVGVLCQDGVVIGSDSSATFGIGDYHIMEQPTKKVDIISDRLIVAGTGQIGLGQRFHAIVQNAWEKKELQNLPAVEVGKLLSAKGIRDFASTQAKVGSYGALVAFPTGHSFNLCEFGIADFQPELKSKNLWYVSMGCGQPITDPFLGFIREVFWNDGLPTIHEAMFAVTWTLDHAIKINPGGINGPIQMAILEKNKKDDTIKAKLVNESELEEHRQNIDEAKNLLRGYRQNFHNGSDSQALSVPVPQPANSHNSN